MRDSEKKKKVKEVRRHLLTHERYWAAGGLLAADTDESLELRLFV
jgi:hypothetical protein